MAIYDDVKITINLNELVEIRAKLQSQYGDYSEQVCKGEYLDESDIDRIATQLRETLTWDTLYFMVDGAILDYLGLKDPKRPNYGETAGDEPAATFEKEQRARQKYVKENFDMVDLDGGSWTIQVPMRKK
tara:strand:- start:6 stop:395 length:390 start_codon:yes stop_codon:yes gene_type:complete